MILYQDPPIFPVASRHSCQEGHSPLLLALNHVGKECLPGVGEKLVLAVSIFLLFFFSFCFFFSPRVPFRCSLNVEVFLFGVLHASWRRTAGCIGAFIAVSGQLLMFSTKHQLVSTSAQYLTLHSAEKQSAIYSSAVLVHIYLPHFLRQNSLMCFSDVHIIKIPCLLSTSHLIQEPLTFFFFFFKRKVRSSNLHILKSFMPLGDQSLSCSRYFKLANQWRRSGMKMKDPASLDPCHFFFF